MQEEQTGTRTMLGIVILLSEPAPTADRIRLLEPNLITGALYLHLALSE